MSPNTISEWYYYIWSVIYVIEMSVYRGLCVRRRSYCIRITGAGKDEIDRMYYYYLDPLYTLQKNMKKEKFETLFQLIREANEILSSQKK